MLDCKWNSGGVGSEFDAESLYHAEPPAAGASGLRRGQSSVESLARDSGLAGELGHSHGARNIAECGCDQRWVAVLEGGFKIGGDAAGRGHVLGGVPECGFMSHFEP